MTISLRQFQQTFVRYDSGFPKFHNVQSYRIVVYSAWLLGIVFIGIYTGNLVAALSTMKGKSVKVLMHEI